MIPIRFHDTLTSGRRQDLEVENGKALEKSAEGHGVSLGDTLSLAPSCFSQR